MSLRLAIIGTGKVAREEYVPFLASQPDVTLGYYNRTTQSARTLAEHFKGEVFPNLLAVAQWKPTAALVLTSETARYEVSQTLIESGVPKIFFEKPLVAAAGQANVTEDDFQRAKKLLELAKARNCESAIVFNYRFFEQTLNAKRLIEQRRLGNVTSVTALVHYACWSHAIDLIRHIAGDVAEISAIGGQLKHLSSELKSEATDVAAAFRFANGATGTILGTLAMKWQHPLYEIVFNFENGRLHIRDLDGTLELLDGAQETHETITYARHHSRWDAYRDSFKKAVGAYLDSLRTNQPPPVPGIEGLYELQFEAAIKRSIAERKPVRIAEEFPIGELAS